jgi:hypothetical protein
MGIGNSNPPNQVHCPTTLINTCFHLQSCVQVISPVPLINMKFWTNVKSWWIKCHHMSKSLLLLNKNQSYFFDGPLRGHYIVCMFTCTNSTSSLNFIQIAIYKSWILLLVDLVTTNQLPCICQKFKRIWPKWPNPHDYTSSVLNELVLIQ